MDIRHLQYFVVSADAGSFLRASEILFTTQSHISKAMKSLEDEIGCPLFRRRRNGVELTEKGAELYAAATEILADYGKIERLKQTTGRRSLRVGFSQSLSFLPLPGLYTRSEPDCLISSRNEALFSLILAIHELNVSLGLVTVYDTQRTRLDIELQKYQLRFEPLAETEQSIWLRREHPFSAKAAGGSEALALLSFAETETQGALEERGLSLPERSAAHCERLRMLTGSGAELLSALRNSDLAYLGYEPFPRLLEGEGLRCVAFEKSKERAATGFICRSDLPLPAEAEAFRRFVIENYPVWKDVEG